MENKLSTNKSLTSQYLPGVTKNNSRNPFQDKKKRYRKKLKPLTKEQAQVFKQAFQIFDTDQSGTIDQVELKALLTALGYECSSELVRKIMDTIDEDGSGVIQMNQFIRFMSRHILSTDHLKKQMSKIFDYFDDQLLGFLDHKKIKKMVNQSLFSIDDQGIEKMIEAADTDGSGKISKDEFFRVMKKIKIL